jgi:hypothetical protein
MSRFHAVPQNTSSNENVGFPAQEDEDMQIHQFAKEDDQAIELEKENKYAL